MVEEANDSNKPLQVGTVIAGRYEIAAQLAKSSYKVFDASGGRTCLLKFSPLESSEFAKSGPDKSLLSFQHENAVGLIDVQSDPAAGPFCVREFIEGKTLGQVIAEKGFLNQIEFLDTFEQACQALTYMHKKGLLHANLKSSNIIIAENSLVRVVDPLSAVAPRSTIATDPQLDICSLGCLMYESLSGKKVTPKGEEPVPFSSLLPARNVDEQVEKVIFRCLNKDPKQRYPSAESLKADLKRIEEGLQIKEIPKANSGSASSKRLALIIPAALLVLLSIGTLVYFATKPDGPRSSNQDDPASNATEHFSESVLAAEEKKADEAIKRKDYFEAARILNVIEPGFSNTMGNESRAHVRILHKLARAQLLNKECDQARDSYRLLAGIVKRNPNLAPGHLQSQLSAEVFGIANEMYKQGDYKNVNEAYSTALIVEKALHEEKSPVYYYILIACARCEAKDDDFERAEKNFERAINKFETIYDDPKNLKLALCSYAEALIDRANSPEGSASKAKLLKRAKAVLEDALQVAKDRLSPQDLAEVKSQMSKL